MEFNAHKPIYLQICSQLYEQILRGELKADDRILSVRDYGIQLGVNPNTIMRSYETMTAAGIIYNKRGIGYLLSTLMGLVMVGNSKRIELWMERFDEYSPEEVVQLWHNATVWGMIIGIIITCVLLYFTYRKIKTQKY